MKSYATIVFISKNGHMRATCKHTLFATAVDNDVNKIDFPWSKLNKAAISFKRKITACAKIYK